MTSHPRSTVGRASWSLLVMAAALATGGVSLAGRAVQAPAGAAAGAGLPGVPLLPLLPPLWVTGETHGHIQPCSLTAPDLTPAELLAQHEATETQVVCAQIWGTLLPDLPGFVANYVPLVTGAEHPVSLADPDYLLQFGVEVSGFEASQFGHPQCLGVSNAMFPFTAQYGAPILDFFRAQPGAITGYAHVNWPISYQVADVPLAFAETFGLIGYLAPTDTALGKVDFLETINVFGPLEFTSHSGAVHEFDWRGMYYKLLNAGLRPSLTAGRDSLCGGVAAGSTMTFARVAQEPLDFQGWAQAIKAGRTSVATGRQFLNLAVNGKEIGSEVHLAAPGPVNVGISLTLGEPSLQGAIAIVKDGLSQPVTYPYSLAAGQSAAVNVPVQFDESGWIAASAVSGSATIDAHTGPVYVIVSNQPIASALDAGYWSAYSSELVGKLGNFPLGSPPAVAQIGTHVLKGRKVFEALRAGALPLPSGAVRYGSSTGACEGPIQINVSGLPVVGAPGVLLTNVHAPPSSPGFLVVGYLPNPSGLPKAKGAGLFVASDAILLIVPIIANSGGYHELPVQFPASAFDVTLYFQYFWKNLPGCPAPSGALYSASDAIALTVQ
ncbi:MAG TPA: CehA/McbA family metallohydrolase [Planctomycetota bacterium]|nr:CehA/McbA family metallohydrolase [Planctomycetota bacterium]